MIRPFRRKTAKIVKDENGRQCAAGEDRSKTEAPPSEGKTKRTVTLRGWNKENHQFSMGSVAFRERNVAFRERNVAFREWSIASQERSVAFRENGENTPFGERTLAVPNQVASGVGTPLPRRQEVDAIKGRSTSGSARRNARTHAFSTFSFFSSFPIDKPAHLC